MTKTYIWMSFRDPDKDLNLGVAVVEARDMTEALVKITKLGINPGGEVVAYEMNEEMFKSQNIDKDRLYTREEIKALGFQWINDE